MKKLVCIALLAIGCSVNAQWKKELKQNSPQRKEVYNYYSHGDIIAKKWISTELGKKFATSVSEHEYCIVWKAGYDNYISFLFDKETIKVEKDNQYTVFVVMEDNSMIEAPSIVDINEDNQFEFMINLNSAGIGFLKTKKIKEFRIEIAGENHTVDSKENNLDVDFIKRTANLVWPES